MIGSTFSKYLPIFSGVPQGGSVGLLLFIICINHIASEIDISSNTNIFADDTNILADLTQLYKNL